MASFTIIGAGFSGLAVAYHLLQLGIKEIDLYDKRGIGGGASGIAAGLLHPYAGAHAKKNPYADEGMAATRALIQDIEKTVGIACAEQKGILRIALNEEQLSDYRRCADLYEDVSWIDDASQHVQDAPTRPGILIHSGMNINCQNYLRGLWKYCEERGVRFLSSKINNLHEISTDKIIVAGGMETLDFQELAHLKLQPIKGQILELAWPEHLPPLPLPLNSQAYLVMDPSGKSVWAGATFERHFKDEAVDVAKAVDYLQPKIEALYPPLEGAAVLSCKVAIRAATPDHQPLCGRVGERLFYLTGLGSKGLLYHAHLARHLALDSSSDAAV